MKRFVDTSAWIALFDSRDRYHSAAAAALHGARNRPHLVTSDYVLDETSTYLLNRAGKGIAVRCIRWVLDAAYVDILHVHESVWHDAWTMFEQYGDKQWSFTNCTTFVLMRHNNLNEAFTFDRHFEQAGFRLWPAEGR